MKTFLFIACFAISLLAQPGQVQSSPVDDPVQLHATLELSDGSRLVGTPQSDSVMITLDYGKIAIPLEQIRSCVMNRKSGDVTVIMQNGDRMTGRLDLKTFKVETLLGPLAPTIEQIDQLTIATQRKSNMPSGKGDVRFGGVDWLAWRTGFEIAGDKAESLPKARAGFNYGHSGNGRGPLLMTNIGNSDWKNYSIEAEFCVPGVDPAFNPYGLPGDFHDGAILFHVADIKESFNESGTSAYYFDVRGNGDWSLRCIYNSYCDQPVGWGNPRDDAQRTLASGNGLKVDRVNGNKYRIDVVGKHINIWVDGKNVVDLTDDKMDQAVGSQCLDHGGVGFVGAYDSMIWVRNFSARTITGKE